MGRGPCPTSWGPDDSAQGVWGAKGPGGGHTHCCAHALVRQKVRL